MAQRGDLFRPDQLPTARSEPPGISHRCPRSLAVHEDYSDSRSAARPLEIPVGGHQLKFRITTGSSNAKPSRRHEPPPSGLTDSGRVTAASFTATIATLDGASPPLGQSPYTTPVRAARPCASPPAYAPPSPECNPTYPGKAPTSRSSSARSARHRWGCPTRSIATCHTRGNTTDAELTELKSFWMWEPFQDK